MGCVVSSPVVVAGRIEGAPIPFVTTPSTQRALNGAVDHPPKQPEPIHPQPLPQQPQQPQQQQQNQQEQEPIHEPNPSNESNAIAAEPVVAFSAPSTTPRQSPPHSPQTPKSPPHPETPKQPQTPKQQTQTPTTPKSETAKEPQQIEQEQYKPSSPITELKITYSSETENPGPRNNVRKSLRLSRVIEHNLTAYVPAVVASLYHDKGGQPISGPICQGFEAALFFADISNFSVLAETLSQHKDLDGGSDRLTELMNGYLGTVSDTIMAHGGDIIEFAGDSFLAMWKKQPGTTLADCTLRAIQCAMVIQDSVGNYIINSGTHLIELQLRVEIGAGKVLGQHVGVTEVQRRDGEKSKGGRWLYILSGNQVDETMSADRFNSPGNVVLTKAAWNLVEQHCVGTKLETADLYHVTKLNTSVTIQPLARAPKSQALESMVSQYVPSHVADQQGAWLAEVRNVTMMFIRLPMGDTNPLDSQYHELLQDSCADIIQTVAHFDGMLAHLSYDDKGLYAVVVFGIPSHEDDPVRAVYASVQLVKLFYARNLTLCVGIATGIAVAGSVGSSQRCQYTVFGAVVNLAARLMHLSHMNVRANTKKEAVPESSDKREEKEVEVQKEPPKQNENEVVLVKVTANTNASKEARLAKLRSNQKISAKLTTKSPAKLQKAPSTKPPVPKLNPSPSKPKLNPSPSKAKMMPSPSQAKSTSPYSQVLSPAYPPIKSYSRAALQKMVSTRSRLFLRDVDPEEDTKLSARGQPLVGNFGKINAGDAVEKADDLIVVPDTPGRVQVVRQESLRKSITAKDRIPSTNGKLASLSKQDSLRSNGGLNREDSMASNSSKTSEHRQRAAAITSMAANTILCDEETYHLARSRFYFLPLDPVQIKGFSKKIACYAPEVMLGWQRNTHGNEDMDTTQAAGKVATVVGRDVETNAFIAAADNMLDAKGGSTILFEGEPGQGKSVLIKLCASLASQKGYFVLSASADAIETTTMYYAFRDILKKLAGITEIDTNESGRKKIEAIVPPTMHDFLAFFNLILPLDFKETEVSAITKGTARTSMLKKMMVGLLQQMAREEATLLIIDDLQWLDSSSWEILHATIFEVHPLMVLLGTRAIPSPPPAPYKRLIDMKVKQFKLAPFGKAEVTAFVTKTFGLQADPPDSLVELLLATTSGNPFFIRELLLVLKDTGVVKIENGVAVHVPPAGGSEAIPHTLNNVIISRVDRLDPTSKLILRIASVLGRNFLWTALTNVFPQTEKKENLEEKLALLEEAGLVTVPEFTSREACLDGEAPFNFVHITIQQVIYGSMVAKQRQQLHSTIAKWYIAEHNNNESIFPFVYYHYLHAEKHAEALEYCIKSAEYSQSASAYSEALDFFSQALESKAANTLTPPQLCKIRTSMGEACAALGRFYDAIEQFRLALILIGVGDPYEAIEPETNDSLISKFMQQVDALEPPVKGSPEASSHVAKAVLYMQFSMQTIWTPNNTKLIIYGFFNVYIHSWKTGWIDQLPGCTSSLYMILKTYRRDAEADRFERQTMEILHKMLASTAPTPPAFVPLVARTLMATIPYLSGNEEIPLGYQMMDIGCNLARQMNDMRLVAVIESTRMLGLIAEGRFEEGAEIANAYTKKCHLNGDFMQLGMIFPIYETFCLLYLGRLNEAKTKINQIEATISTAAPGSVEVRSIMVFAALKSLYHLWKGEYDAAWEAIENVANSLCTMMLFLFSYTYTITIAMEVLITLGMQENAFTHSDAAWNLACKLFPAYERFAGTFSSCMPRCMLFENQLNSYEYEKQVRLCEQARDRANKAGLKLDEGLALMELAKCYPRNNVNYITNCEQASEIFEQIGAMHHFIEVETKYYKTKSLPKMPSSSITL